MKVTDEIKKFRSMGEQELNKELASLRKKLAVEKLSVAANKSENYSALSKLKVSIARILTILGGKESGE